MFSVGSGRRKKVESSYGRLKNKLKLPRTFSLLCFCHYRLASLGGFFTLKLLIHIGTPGELGELDKLELIVALFVSKFKLTPDEINSQMLLMVIRGVVPFNILDFLHHVSFDSVHIVLHVC